MGEVYMGKESPLVSQLGRGVLGKQKENEIGDSLLLSLLFPSRLWGSRDRKEVAKREFTRHKG